MTPSLGATCQRWVPILIVAVALAAGCATLNDRPPLPTSAAPDVAKAYVYGRFKLNPGSASAPRLYLQLTNLATGEFLSIYLRTPTEELYLLDLAPGQYQFTHLLFAPIGAMDMDVKRSPIRVPGEMSFLLKPFRVEVGKAYYVGDWTGVLARDVDHYVVFATIKQRWGVYRVAFDHAGATAELRRLYPALGSLDARPAWAD